MNCQQRKGNTRNQHGTNTEPFGRALVFAEQNFATSPNPNFDQVNCLDDQTRVSSTRPVSGPG